MTNTEIIQAIRNEIERLKTVQLKRIQEGDLVDAEPYDKIEAYNELLSFLSTLESEKPMNLEEEINRYLREECSDDDEPGIHEIAEHFAKWGAEHLASTGKTSPKDLEEAADNHIRKVVDAAGHPGWDWTIQDIADAFIAGAKWQAEHSPFPEDTVLFNKGVEEGKRLMMEEFPKWRQIKAGERLPCPAYVWTIAYDNYPDCFEGRLMPNIEGVKVGRDTWYLPVDVIHNLPKED